MPIVLEYTQIASPNSINNLISFTMEANIFDKVGINSLNILETDDMT